MAKTSEDGWWMVQRMVLPRVAMSFIILTMILALKESRPVAGSSQNSRGGSVRICARERVLFSERARHEGKEV